MVQRLFYRNFHCRNTVCVYYIYACGKAANGFAAAFERYDLHTFSCGGKYSYFALKRKRFKLYHALLWQYIEHFACGFDAFIGFAVGFNNRTVSVYGVLQTACNECLRKYTWGNQEKTDCRNKELFLFHACRMLVQR